MHILLFPNTLLSLEAPRSTYDLSFGHASTCALPEWSFYSPSSFRHFLLLASRHDRVCTLFVNWLIPIENSSCLELYPCLFAIL
jgi:hypothetical protein